MDKQFTLIKKSIHELSELELSHWYHFLTNCEVNYQRVFFDKLIQLAQYAFLGFDGNGQLIAACAVSYIPQTLDHKKTIIIKTNLVYIDRTFRGGKFIRRAGWYSMRHAKKHYPKTPLFWASVLLSPKAYLLIGKTFSDFYPHPYKKTPRKIKTIMQTIASGQFKNDYHQGIFNGKGLQSISPIKIQHQTNQRSQMLFHYFNQLNPNYSQGFSLTCIVPLTTRNIFSLLIKGIKKQLLIKNKGMKNDLPQLQNLK